MEPVIFRGTGAMYADAIVVRTRKELAKAALQHVRPIRVEGWWLALPFLLLLAVQGVPALERVLTEAISAGYKVELSGSAAWRAFRIDGNLILTPASKPSQTPSDDGEQ
jgi:hypothetical protein